MDWGLLASYWPNYRDWLWIIEPLSVITLIWLVRGLIYMRKSQRKNSKRYNSEDGRRFYEYWHDGYDLKSEQLVDFHMSFDDREKADQVAFGLTRNFDIIENRIGRQDDRWRLTITLRIIPSSEKMDEIRKELSAAAEYAGGVYDGWSLRS